MLLNVKDTFKQLQTFHDISGLNRAVKHHKRLISSTKHKNIYAVLDYISQYSCVYFGVSFLSQNSIATELNISYKTVQRAVDKLVELGIVIKHASKRASGDKRQTSNILVIQPVIDESVQPEVSNQEAPQLNSKSNNTDETEKSVVPKESDKQTLIKDGLVAKLPPTLQHALAPFFDYQELYALAGVVFKAKATVDKSVRIEEHEAEYYQAIIEIMSAFKRGKVRNLAGLLSHAVKATTRSIWIRSTFEESYGFPL